MPRQTLTPQATPGNYPGTIAANAADITFVACDATNKEQFLTTGKELLLFRNDNAGAQTVTITSVADAKLNRTGDITTYSIGAGESAIFGPFLKEGWMQSDGYIYSEASHLDVKVAVLRIP